MIMLGDKKKAATVIVASLGKSRRGDPEYDEETYDKYPDDIHYGLEAAMDRFLKASEAKDPEKMSYYLKDFVEICFHYYKKLEGSKIPREEY